MPIITNTDIRNYLEGFGLTTTVISNAWIENRISRFIVPTVERILRTKLGEVVEVLEYHSGNGSEMLLLNRGPIQELISLQFVQYVDYPEMYNIANIEIVKSQGILRTRSNLAGMSGYSPLFPKGKNNLKVRYTYGFDPVPEDIKEALILLTCDAVLGFLGSKTGGGSGFGVKELSRSFGNRGKWTELRNDMARQAKQILQSYQIFGSGA